MGSSRKGHHVHRMWVAAAAVLALGLTSADAQADARTRAPDPPGWQVRIAGPASIDSAYTGMYARTAVRIPVQVRCPAGEVGYGVHAGFPGSFQDQARARPELPSMTGPLLIRCDGHPHRYWFTGRSISRNQDPALYPFERFHRGRITVVVEVRRSVTGTAGAVRDTRRVRVVVPAAQR